MHSTTLTPSPSIAAWRLARAAGLCLLLVCSEAEIRAQSSSPGRKKTVAGVAKQFTTDIDTGEINGMMLEDGTIIRWWPHLSKRFTSLVAKGDKVEVTGRLTTTPKNVTVIQADSVTNLKTKISRVNNDDPRPAPGGLPDIEKPNPEKLKTIRGTVKRLTTATDESVNGMVLTDGTVVRWPATMSRRFTEIVTTGARVQVVGKPVQSPEKSLVLDAQAVTNERTNATVTVPREKSPPAAVRPGAQKPKTVTGTVKRFTTAASGQTDGMVLDNGTEVRWPVPLEKRFTSVLARGNRVEVIGREEALPGGKIILQADTVNNLTSKQRAVADEAVRPPLPPPPPASVRVDALEKRVRTLEDRIDKLTKAVEALGRQR